MIEKQFFDAMRNFTGFGGEAEPSNREILNIDHKLIEGMKKLGGLIVNLTEWTAKLHDEQKRTNDQRDSWDVGGWIMYFMFAGFVLFFFSKIVNNAITRLTYNSIGIVNHGAAQLQAVQNNALQNAANNMPNVLGAIIGNLGNALSGGENNRLAITGRSQRAFLEDVGTDSSDSEENEIDENGQTQNPNSKLKRSNSQELKISPQNDDLG